MKDITFEDKLWKAADKLRKKVEVHEYKYIVLGLIFLRYVSFAFEEVREKIKEEYKNDPDLEKNLKTGMSIFQKGFCMFQKTQGGII
jgi:type I restriction-modification system DNA methylase subunit